MRANDIEDWGFALMSISLAIALMGIAVGTIVYAIVSLFNICGDPS